MNPVARRSNFWAAVVAVAVLLLFFYLIRGVLLPFVVAGALAFLGAPLVKILRCRLRVPHVVAVIAVFILFIAIAGSVAYWVHLVLVPQVISLAKDLPRLIEKTVRGVIGGDHAVILGQKISAANISNAVMLKASGFVSPGALLKVFTSVFEGVMAIFLTLVLFFYMLFDGRKLFNGALHLVPPVMRVRVRVLALKTRPMLINYIRGLAVIVVYACTLTYVGVGLIIHLPHAALLSLATGLLELVPVIGPVASATLLGVVSIEQGLGTAIAFAVFAVVLRLSIDQLLGPLILGKAVTLHPVVIIFAFLAGAAIMGVLGVLIAVPVAATIKIVLDYLYESSGVTGETTDALVSAAEAEAESAPHALFPGTHKDRK